MTANKQFLTKSRFKIGTECATKLFYLDNKQFGNNNTENSFLAALAEGGFQVGELAKVYFPNGTEITTRDKNEAALQTAKLLKSKSIIIYEASFKFQNLFIKADILVKSGNSIQLIEVKAKSIDSQEDNVFYSKRSLKKGPLKLNSEWEPYLLDVAFQTYVLKKSFPTFQVSSFLLLADKNAVASVDGINQRFFLEKTSAGQAQVRTSEGTNRINLGNDLLVGINVDKEVNLLLSSVFEDGKSFEQRVNHLSQVCENQEFVKPIVGSHCKSCEFRIGQEKIASGLKSGFNNCWSKAQNISDSDLIKPFIFDVWNFRKTSELLDQNKILMCQIEEEDISPSSKDVGLSTTERQWLQIKKQKENDRSPFFDAQGLWKEMKAWIFPLHFIDFETTMVAVPFNEGRRPYEQMAFQFSHHQLNKDGSIVHKDEYINRIKGKFPNFDFVRALKKSLGEDSGTVFRFAAHENTVLCQIRNQLFDSIEKDKVELIRFIETITKSSDEATGWEGSRNMVDMCELVKKYYYHPLTGGSNSIKKVLPAILNESAYLQEKYSQPIYGSAEIHSCNYSNWKWIEIDQMGKVIDPYRRLPPVFTDIDLETMESLVTEGSIADGGAAMTAYVRMQFTEMSEAECEKVSKALLKYCELDTFAMVMIYEYWKYEIRIALGLKEAA